MDTKEEIREFIRKMDLDDREELILTLMEDYVNYNHNFTFFSKGVMNWHRFLQGELYKLFYNICLEWSKCENYDIRNKAAVENSKKIIKLL